MTVLKEAESCYFKSIKLIVQGQLLYAEKQHRYLSVPSSLHHGHDDVLCGHEGQLMTDVSLNDFGIDHQSLCDVLQGTEDDVGCQEGLGERDPPASSRGNEISKSVAK